MLHRIEWVEHSSKRDGETHLTFHSLAAHCNSAFILNEMMMFFYLLLLRSRCWWWHEEEQQMLVGLGGKRPICFWFILPLLVGFLPVDMELLC